MPNAQTAFVDEDISVLVADDDPIFRNLVTARLSPMGGRAMEAADGHEAWNMLMSRSFDLAIVDLSMPNLDGFELIGCMRNHQRTRHMPIVVVTSRNDLEAIRQAFDAGATAFLTKPVNWETFGNYIGFLLRLAAAHRRALTSDRLSSVLVRANETLLDNLCVEIGRLTAVVSHALAMAGEKPGGSQFEEQRARAIGHAIEATNQLQLLASGAERLSRLFAEEISVADRKANLQDILRRSIATIEGVTTAAGVEIELMQPAADLLLSCNAASIEAVVVELMRNAIAHSKPGQSIQLSHKIFDDGMLAIELHDSGAGMHPEFVASALNARHAMAKANHSGRPAGFGLPLARAVAEAHGGALEIRSMVGEGTTAMLILPPDRVFQTIASAA